jgi:hypothetical protein
MQPDIKGLGMRAEVIEVGLFAPEIVARFARVIA